MTLDTSALTESELMAGPIEPEPAPARVAEQQPELVIEPSAGWQVLNLSELWRYRELLFFFAWRDVKVRYKQTILGAAWAVFQPVLMMAVFWLFLGKFAKVPSGELPYTVFVYPGLVAWFLFANTVTAASVSLLDSERLISKVYFPRLTVPFAAAGPALIDFGVATVVLVGLMVTYGAVPTWSALLVPPAVGLIVITALGVGTFFAALNVAYRDFRYVVPFLMQVWLFATPSIYLATTSASEDVPEIVRWVLIANPMTGLIDFFRAALFGIRLPWPTLGLSAAVGIGFFVAACAYFRRVEDSFADII